MKHILFLVMVVLLVSPVYALSISGPGDKVDDVPINNKVSWKDFLQTPREKIDINFSKYYFVVPGRAYELIQDNEPYFFQVSNSAESSVQLEFFRDRESLFLYVNKSEEVVFNGDRYEVTLLSTQNLAGYLEFEYSPRVREEFPLEESFEETINDTLEAPVEEPEPEVEEVSEEINETEEQDEEGGENIWVIIGLVIGALVILSVVAIIILALMKTPQSRQKEAKVEKKILEKEGLLPELEDKPVDEKNIFTYDEYERLKVQINSQEKAGTLKKTPSKPKKKATKKVTKKKAPKKTTKPKKKTVKKAKKTTKKKSTRSKK